MLTGPPAARIFVSLAPTDLRCSFDGLSARVRRDFGADPHSGHMFVFCNRRRDMVKILCWDRTGFWVWAKRLERGTFRFVGASAQVEIDWAELTLVLEGIELDSVRRRPRWRPARAAA